mgnify:CR=1 FL=1
MLNDKQKRFCEEYIIDLNATQAYIRTGYSENGAKESASKLLTNPNIKEYIAYLQQEIQERTKVTLDSVVFRINAIADGSEEDTTQLKALDMLMKHLGGYAVEIAKSTEPLRIQVERISKS